MKRLTLRAILTLPALNVACTDPGSPMDDEESTGEEASEASEGESEGEASTGSTTGGSTSSDSGGSSSATSSTSGSSSSSGSNSSSSGESTSGSTSGDESGDDTSGDTGGDSIVAAAFPGGLAVASPTARQAGPMPVGSRSYAGAVTVESGKSYAQKDAELDALIHGQTEADCELILGNLNGNGYNPLCYGPSLDYRNHPDAQMGMTDGMLPGGDLGIWSASEPDGQACAAAKLNGLVDDVGLKVDYGLYLSANMLCLMNVAGTALPGVSEELDLTTVVDASLGTSNPSITVTAATIARAEDDVDGHAVYEFALEIEATMEGSPMPLVMDARVRHSSDPTEASSYHGRVWSRFDHQPPENRTYAYSLDYERSADNLRYRVLGANYMPNASNVFESDGSFMFGGDYDGNLTQGIFEIDPESGSTSASFAWQAGTGDDKTRVFNVYTDVVDKEGSGCGFFGFGPNFTQTAAPDNSISTFICNWAGPGNNHVGEVGFAQKQCMETDDMGKYVATTSAIAYAPVNDCDTTEDVGFEYKAFMQSDWNTDPIARDLIELASDSDYAGWVAPQPPGG